MHQIKDLIKGKCFYWSAATVVKQKNNVFDS